MKRLTLILLLFSLLAACSPSGEQAAPAAETTLEPTAVVESEAPRSTNADNAELPAPVLEETEPTTAAAAETAVTEPTVAATVAVVEPTATPEEAAADEPAAADGPMVVSGRLDEGAFFRGDPNAPVTLIDYSDFLWTQCRAYVLGTEPQLVQAYVETDKVKLVFWPVLNHGDPSFYSTLTSECVGQQNPDLFWDVHEILFAQQSELWRADRDYYVQTAVAVGADQAEFEACYDGAEGTAKVLELDDLRRQRGIYSQPTFDINGTIQGGAPRFEIFAAVLDDAYNAATP